MKKERNNYQNDLCRFFVNSAGEKVEQDARVWEYTGAGPDTYIPNIEARAYRAILGPKLESLFCFELIPGSSRAGLATCPGIITPSEGIAQILAEKVHRIIFLTYHEHGGLPARIIESDPEPRLVHAYELRVAGGFADNEIVRYAMGRHKIEIQKVIEENVDPDFIANRFTIVGFTPKVDEHATARAPKIKSNRATGKILQGILPQ